MIRWWRRWRKAHRGLCTLLAVAVVVFLFPWPQGRYQALRAASQAPESPAFQLASCQGIFVAHSRRFWTLRPNTSGEFVGKSVYINGLGMRDVQTSRSEDIQNAVLLLGDSCMFGHGVADNQTVAQQYQSILHNQQKMPITVLNGGIPGYSSYQGTDWAEEIAGHRLPVKSLVIAYGWGDRGRESVSDRQRARLYRAQAARDLLHTLSLYRFLYGLLASDTRDNTHLEVARVTPEDTCLNFLRIRRTFGNVPSVFVVMPSRIGLEANDKYVSALEQAAAQQPGASILNVNRMWSQQYSPSETAALFLDDVHLTARGCRLLAEALAAHSAAK